MSKPAKKPKAIPKFRSHEEAGVFWMSHDAAEYLDLSKTQPVRFTSLRKVYLAERIAEERRAVSASAPAPSCAVPPARRAVSRADPCDAACAPPARRRR